ncbi:hypothetical protein [uncultured Phenylobacterium sp.]|uniref:hypothetical protein n=1 Tax=uncultured Phenylobacterium sp. TaxID=349273 RepID=UPI0025D07152|nr:hypothetical protein [uncultured Phenylobacterium sp.]
MTAELNDTYFDRSEFLKAVADPEYRASARRRDEVAQKLQRSLAAGTLQPMGEQIMHGQRNHERNAYYENDNANGYTVGGADPTWAAAGQVATRHFFRSREEVAQAMSAPAFDVDPSYGTELYLKVQRSIREGHLGADFLTAAPQATEPNQRQG